MPGANPGGYRQALSTPFDIAHIPILCVLKRVSLWGIYRKKGAWSFWGKEIRNSTALIFSAIAIDPGS